MKTDEEVEKLVNKTLKNEEKLASLLESYKKQSLSEENLRENINLAFDKAIPTAVKSLILIDKANTLTWVRYPSKKEMDIINLKSTELTEEEMSEVLKDLHRIDKAGKKLDEAVKNQWYNFLGVLQLLKKSVNMQLDLIEQLDHLINEYAKNKGK